MSRGVLSVLVFPLLMCVYPLEQVCRVKFGVETPWLVNLLVAVPVSVLAFLAVRRRPESSVPFVCAIGLLGLCFFLRDDVDAKYKVSHGIAHVFCYGILGAITFSNLKQLGRGVVVFLIAAIPLLAVVYSISDSSGSYRGIVLSSSRRLTPLDAASLAGRAVICAIFLQHHRAWFPATRVALVALKLVVVCLCVLIVSRSGTRAQGVAALAAVLMWFPVSSGIKSKRILAAVTVVGVVALGFYWVVNNLDSAFVGRWSSERLNQSYRYRYFLSSLVLRAWWDGGAYSWILGLGNGSSWSIAGIYPHCVPVEVLAEEGAIGFALFAVILITGIYAGWLLLKLRISRVHKSLIGMMLAMLTFEFALCCKQSYLLGSPYLFLIALGLARLLGNARSLRLARS